MNKSAAYLQSVILALLFFSFPLAAQVETKTRYFSGKWEDLNDKNKKGEFFVELKYEPNLTMLYSTSYFRGFPEPVIQYEKMGDKIRLTQKKNNETISIVYANLNNTPINMLFSDRTKLIGEGAGRDGKKILRKVNCENKKCIVNRIIKDANNVVITNEQDTLVEINRVEFNSKIDDDRKEEYFSVIQGFVDKNSFVISKKNNKILKIIYNKDKKSIITHAHNLQWKGVSITAYGQDNNNNFVAKKENGIQRFREYKYQPGQFNWDKIQTYDYTVTTYNLSKKMIDKEICISKSTNHKICYAANFYSGQAIDFYKTYFYRIEKVHYESILAKLNSASNSTK